MPTVIKDGQTLRDSLIAMDLPETAKLFTNAVSMYPNKEFNHALQIMHNWLECIPTQYHHHDFKPEAIQANLNGST
jgi:hypothetical protein